MYKKLITALITAFWCTYLHAQIPPGCGSEIIPAEDCQSACINCNFNGYIGNTEGWTADPEPIDWCSDIQNDQWFGFIAGGTTAFFTITPANCGNGAGIQAAVYPAGCNDAPLACNSGCITCGTTPAVLTVNNMIPGNNYYLVVDGYGGDTCDFTINVMPSSAVQAPLVGVTPDITGAGAACSGGTYSYSVATVSGAGFYTWTASVGGVLFNGEEGPVDLEAPGGRTVMVTFPPGLTGNVNVCVTPSNACNQGVQKCKTIALSNLPVTYLPKAIVCSYEVPYTLPWGDDAYTNGTYSFTYPNTNGCDSIVQQQVQILPPIFTNIIRYVCEGTCYSICNVEYYCTDGHYSETCTSYQGCDSTVYLTLKVLAPVAKIIAPTTVLSCNTSSIQLTSEFSPNFPGASVKVWKDLATGQILAGNTYTVTAPGTYILTTTMSAGVVQCSQSDTINITATPGSIPVQATGGVLGCGNDTITLTASALGTELVYSWSGPNGFISSEATPQVVQAGTYQVTITDNLNCSGTASTTVTIGGDIPDVLATGDTLTCFTPSVQITGYSAVPDVTYHWSGPNGLDSTGPIQTVTQPGLYTLTVTTPDGCSNTATAMVVGQTSDLTLQYFNGYTGCSPTATLICNSDALAPAYQWTGPDNYSSSVAQPVVSAAGTYFVTVTDQVTQCKGIAMLTVTENNEIPSIVVEQVVNPTGGQNNGSIDVSVGNAPEPFTYNWYFNGPLFAHTEDVSGLAPGIYNCVVTAANGCAGVQTFSLETVATQEAIAAQWYMTPNPSNGTFYLVRNGDGPDLVSLQVYDVNGRQVWHLSPSAQKNDYLIQLNNMPSGVYWVEIRDEEGVYWGKVVVQR